MKKISWICTNPTGSNRKKIKGEKSDSLPQESTVKIYVRVKNSPCISITCWIYLELTWWTIIQITSTPSWNDKILDSKKYKYREMCAKLFIGANVSSPFCGAPWITLKNYRSQNWKFIDVLENLEHSEFRFRYTDLSNLTLF